MKVPYQIWFNHDTTNILTCTSPYHKQGEDFTEEMLRTSIDELAGTGVDAVSLSPGNGAVPWWQSKVYPDHWQWYQTRTGKELSSYGKYVNAGGDMVRVFCEQCRKHGIAPVLSLRLKDEHSIEHLDNESVSKFFYEHQSWRIDRRPEAQMGWRGLNWIYPAVREERLMLIAELAENYDIDGLELDFMRFYPFFDLESTDFSQRSRILTDFIQQVRDILDQTQRGSRRYLAIRVPNRLREHKNLGIDLGLLDQLGIVDMINVSSSYVTQVESDVEFIRALAPNSSVFYELTHCAARGPSCGWGYTGGDDYPIRFTTDTQFYTAANLAYARGADGISLFNFVYTRQYGCGAIEGNFCEPPFYLLQNLKDREFLKQQPQHYWMPYWWKTGYNGRQFQLPLQFYRNSTHTIELDIAKPRKTIGRTIFRLETAGGTPVLSATEPVANVRGTPGLKWNVLVNGYEACECDDVSEPFENPRAGFTGYPEQYYAFSVPEDALREGVNHFTICLSAAPVSPEFSIWLIYTDLSIV